MCVDAPFGVIPCPLKDVVGHGSMRPTCFCHTKTSVFELIVKLGTGIVAHPHVRSGQVASCVLHVARGDARFQSGTALVIRCLANLRNYVHLGGFAVS